jgi:hypothetical protein
MASIERTAYPRYQHSLTATELRLHYTLTDDERAWLQATTRGSARMLCCAVGAADARVVGRHQQCLCYITSHASRLGHHITLRPHVKGEADTTSAGTIVGFSTSRSPVGVVAR